MALVVSVYISVTPRSYAMHCLCQNAQHCGFTLTKSGTPVGCIIGMIIQRVGHFIRKVLITASVITASVIAAPLTATAL